MSTTLDPVLFDAYHKSQDPRDFDKIDNILRNIAEYEKEKQERSAG